MNFLKTILVSLVLTVAALAQTCPPPGQAPTITSATSVTFTEGIASSFTVTGTGTPIPTLSEIGALPTGITFASGKLSGTPALGSAGTFDITLTAKNGVSPDASQAFVLTIFAAQTSGFWQPDLNSSWQWQLSTTPSANSLLNVNVYDVDGEAATTALVAAMHAKGIHAICYLSAGTAENFRSDYAQLTAIKPSVLGKTNGWPGEKWLDIRNVAALGPIMTARMQSCKNKGFDAIEGDNIDGYTNSTGFPLTAAQQLTYNRFLADTAHSLGLSIALKNDGDQVGDLLPYFDFDINEQCAQYSECSDITPFVADNKAVFEAEYQGNQAKACTTLNNDNFNGAFFDLNLTGKRTPCR